MAIYLYIICWFVFINTHTQQICVSFVVWFFWLPNWNFGLLQLTVCAPCVMVSSVCCCCCCCFFLSIYLFILFESMCRMVYCVLCMFAIIWKASLSGVFAYTFENSISIFQLNWSRALCRLSWTDKVADGMRNTGGQKATFIYSSLIVY